MRGQVAALQEYREPREPGAIDRRSERLRNTAVAVFRSQPIIPPAPRLVQISHRHVGGLARLWASILAGGIALASLRPAAFGTDPDNHDSVQQLRLEKFFLPEFPPFVRQLGISRGVVTVAIGRTVEGQVDDILVLHSTDARLTEAAKNAVAEWRFARPSNVPLNGRQIIPIVRFLFNTRGVSMVSPPTGRTGDLHREMAGNAPVILPALIEVDDGPKPIVQPMPQIKGAAANAPQGGSATVKFFIDETGRVRVPIVLECTSPDLGQAAVLAVGQWRFEPPRIGGRPTIAIETQTFSFGAP